MKTKIITFLVGMVLSASAMAMSLQDAKSEGYLGEQRNGYLGVVKANRDAQTVMTQVNAKRRAHYQKIARKNNIGLQEVASLAGGKAIKATAKGNFIQTAAGKWQQK